MRAASRVAHLPLNIQGTHALTQRLGLRLQDSSASSSWPAEQTNGGRGFVRGDDGGGAQWQRQ